MLQCQKTKEWSFKAAYPKQKYYHSISLLKDTLDKF